LILAFAPFVASAGSKFSTSVERCDGSPAQQFSFNDGLIRSVLDGKCLDSKCLDISRGCSPLVFSPCTGSDSLKWEFDNQNRFLSIAHNKSACLDVSSGGAGPAVGIYRLDGGVGQTWTTDSTKKTIRTLSFPAKGARCLENGAPPVGPFSLDRAGLAETFDGIGAISGGGATSRQYLI
jgi:hypothetical protein